MKTFSEFILEREYAIGDDSTLNEMSNLTKRITKLPCGIYVSTHLGVNHGPRIKVNADYGDKWSGSSFIVTISTKPIVIGQTWKIKQADVNDILDWVVLNREVLLSFWKEDIDIAELLDSIQNV